MKIYAISDLHLGQDNSLRAKHINIDHRFNTDYVSLLFNYWQEKVTDNDIVLVPGDVFSPLEEKAFRIEANRLSKLPGTIIVAEGSLDTWASAYARNEDGPSEKVWQKLSQEKKKARRNGGILSTVYHNLTNPYLTIMGCEGIDGYLDVHYIFKKNDFSKTKVHYNSCTCYTRDKAWAELELKINSARKGSGLKIGMLHCPPFSQERKSNSVTQAFAEAGFDMVVFGHLHDPSEIERYGLEPGKPAIVDGVRYFLVSSNFFYFEPMPLIEIGDADFTIPFASWKPQKVPFFGSEIKASAAQNQPVQEQVPAQSLVPTSKKSTRRK